METKEVELNIPIYPLGIWFMLSLLIINTAFYKGSNQFILGAFTMYVSWVVSYYMLRYCFKRRN